MYTPPVRQLYRLVSITEKFYIFLQAKPVRLHQQGMGDSHIAKMPRFFCNSS